MVVDQAHLDERVGERVVERIQLAVGDGAAKQLRLLGAGLMIQSGQGGHRPSCHRLGQRRPRFDWASQGCAEIGRPRRVPVPEGEVCSRLGEKQHPALASPKPKGARQVQAKEIKEVAGRAEGIDVAGRGARPQRSRRDERGLGTQSHGQPRTPRGAGSSVEIAEFHGISDRVNVHWLLLVQRFYSRIPDSFLPAWFRGQIVTSYSCQPHHAQA